MFQASALSARTAIAAQRESIHGWLAAFFAGGAAFYFGLRFEPSVGVTLMLAGLSGIAMLSLWRWREERAVAFTAAILAFAFACGLGAAQFRAHSVHTPMLVRASGPVMVEGTVERIDMMGEGADMRFLLTDLVIEDLAASETPRKIRLRARHGGAARPGQRVSGLASLMPPSPPVAPGAFDFQRTAYFDSIGAVGFFYRAPEVIAATPPSGLAQMIEGWRIHIAARVSERFDQPQAGLIIALMTGQQRAVAKEDYQAMRDSGLAHLLAISGMNVAMIATALFIFSRLLMAAAPWFALRFPVKKIAAVIAFSGALIYTMVAGMSVPTQRAIIMTGIVLLAVCLDRSPFSLRLFAFAVFAVLLFTPENVMGVSFQMSFAAVLALIVFYDRTRGFWIAVQSRAGWGRKASLYVVGVIVTTLIGGTVTGIYALYHFQTYPLYTLLANLIVVPLTGAVIMPAAVAGMALMPFGLGLENWALDIMAWGVTWMLATARWVAGMEGAVLRVTAFPVWMFAGITAGFLFFMLWQGRARLIGLAVMLGFLCLIPFARAPDVLVSADGKLIALRNSESGKLAFSTGRGEAYAAETWLRRNGEDTDIRRPVWPREGVLGDLHCDALACRMERDGLKLSLLRAPRGIGEECAWADMLIAPFPVTKKQCSGPYIIDRFSVWWNGAYALTWTDAPDKVRIDTAEALRGERPWTQTAARRKRAEEQTSP